MLLCTLHSNTIADQTHPLMAMALPQQDNALYHTVKTNGSSNVKKEPKVSSWPPNSPDPHLIQHPWDAPENARSTEAPPHNPEDPKEPPKVLWARPDGSEVFRLDKGDLHNIRQMV